MTKEEAIAQLNVTLWLQRDQGNHYFSDALAMAIKALEQQRVGKWIITKEYNGYETILKDCKCQFCDEKALLKNSYSMDGQSIVLYPSNYCPSCGAKMVKEQESEE